MTRKRLLIAGAVAALAAAAAFLGGVLGDSPGKPQERAALRAEQPPREGVLERLLEGLSTGDTQEFVRNLEAAVEADPYAVESLTLLGLAYQQRARETGDPAYLSLSDTALRRAVSLQRQEPLAFTGLASLSVARHRWNDAIGFAKQALERNPDDASALAALGDAYLSLGRYERAFATFDRVAQLAPSASSFVRVSYARELLGRPGEAIEAIELAFELRETAIPENAAWASVQLGNLQFATGNLDAAERSYREALDRYPGYLLAEAGLARAEAASGRYDTAIRRLERVVDLMPTAQNAILLGDVLTAAGRQAEAEEAYELVEVLERLLAANGVRTELQTALFDLDHGRDLDGALERARAGYEAAPGINSADVLAWALFENGRCDEARGYSIEALRLGTEDALMLFHRGMIERCVGNEAGARRFLRQALEINPHFSFIHAPVARELVA